MYCPKCKSTNIVDHFPAEVDTLTVDADLATQKWSSYTKICEVCGTEFVLNLATTGGQT